MGETLALQADVIGVMSTIVSIRMSEGPKADQIVFIPKAACRDPELICVGDDEIEVFSWLARKDGLL